MSDVCQQCHRKFKQIAQHWSTAESCDHPQLSDFQREVVTGLLMGDGYINDTDKNARLETIMISRNYLEYLDSVFGSFGTGVKHYQTADEAAKEDRNSGFNSDADAADYSDKYRWKTINHPELKDFADWYETGEKVWPEDIELTPTVLRHWYCGDGCYQKSGTADHIQISMLNEVNNTDKIDSMFEGVGLPTPDNYSKSENSFNALWSKENSLVLWDYMGDPLPDFEYKWP